MGFVIFQELFVIVMDAKNCHGFGFTIIFNRFMNCQIEEVFVAFLFWMWLALLSIVSSFGEKRGGKA